MKASMVLDFLNFASGLTFRRLSNMLRVWISFYWSRLTRSSFHPGMPVSISIEPTTACNLGCPECPSGLKMFTRETGNLRSSDLEHWLEQLAPNLTYINFYFQGEPFIHPKFLDLVKFAVARKIYTATSTNAHFITDEIAKNIVSSGLDRLIISLDGTTQEVYEKYRIHGNLNKVIEGTKKVVEQKRLLGSKKPFVIFQFLVVKHNEHQIEDAKRLAIELGVDDVRFKSAQVYDYENGHELIPANDRYSRYRLIAGGRYEVKSKLDNHCWRLWSGAVITWDGKVVPCCFDKDASHRMGDLKTQSFREIWNGAAYREFRKSLFKSRREIDICANCSEGTKVWV